MDNIHFDNTMYNNIENVKLVSSLIVEISVS